MLKGDRRSRCVEEMRGAMSTSLSAVGANECKELSNPTYQPRADARHELCAHLFSRLLLCSETAKHGRGNSRRAMLLHTSHGHAEMTREDKANEQNRYQECFTMYSRSFHDDGYTTRTDSLHDGQGNLLRESLLDLETPGKGFRDPSEL